MGDDRLRNGIRLLRLLQHRIEQALSFRIDRFLDDGVDASGALMVEGCTDTKLISIDLGQSGDRRREHLSVIIMHRHRIICQVDRGQAKSVQVLFVGISIFESIPIHPKVFQVGEVIKVLQLGYLVHSQVKQAQVRVVLKILNTGYLVLLEVEFFKVGKGIKARYLLDVVGLESYQREFCEILKSLNSDKFVLRCVELGQIYKSVNTFNLANLVVADVQDCQIDQS